MVGCPSPVVRRRRWLLRLRRQILGTFLGSLTSLLSDASKLKAELQKFELSLVKFNGHIESNKDQPKVIKKPSRGYGPVEAQAEEGVREDIIHSPGLALALHLILALPLQEGCLEVTSSLFATSILVQLDSATSLSYRAIKIWMATGEEHSKKQATQEAIVRKLRAQVILGLLITNISRIKILLDMMIYKQVKANIFSSSLRKSALMALAKTLTMSQLAYFKEQFQLLGPTKHGSLFVQDFKTEHGQPKGDDIYIHVRFVGR